jgi:cation:H+ antiporter
MEQIYNLIADNQLIAWISLAVSFAVLAKAADIFVDNSVHLATTLKIPKLIIGLVLVSLATTAPELSVSLVAAIKGNPEMALGNAIGSIICNTTLGLGLCGLATVAAIKLIPKTTKVSLAVLFVVEALACFFVLQDKTLSRAEGIVLLAIFFIYTAYLFISHKKAPNIKKVISLEHENRKNIFVILVFFVISVTLIIIASKFIVSSATSIALHFHIKETVIALTLVALGTSIPEVATCITAARKNQGDIAVGNILGANIMNICWVAGASAIANNLSLSSKDIAFMFPTMFIVTITMAILLCNKFQLTRKKGATLLALYIIYTISFFIIYRN